LALVVLAGCAAPRPSFSGPLDEEPPFSERAQQGLDDARASGASEEQLAILQGAVDTGEITFADASEAVLAFVECVNNAGGSAQYEVDDRGAFPVPGYSVYVGEDGDADTGVVGECDKREDLWVNLLYQTQPNAIDAHNADFDKKSPALIACLIENGVAIEDDATRDELQRAGIDLLVSSNESGDPVNCFGEVGIDGF
jgi:hypothetical protein